MTTDKTVNAYTYDPDLPKEELKGKRWQYCKLANFSALQEIVEQKNHKMFVWGEEGRYDGALWRFNKTHEDFQPLLVDIQTANLVVTCYNAASAETKIKMMNMVSRGRGSFMRVVEACWKSVK